MSNSNHTKNTSTTSSLQSEQTTCDICERSSQFCTLYAFPGDNTVQIRYFKIPAEYDRLCSNCFIDANEHTPSDLTENELIAGIISDSYGYATPDHALRHIKDHKDDKDHCHCERGRAEFKNDLGELMEAARRRWVSRSSEEKASLLETVAGWRYIEEKDQATSLGVSMSYPAHAPELTAQQQSNSSDTDLLSLPPQELQNALFIRTDTYRFFTIDTLPNTHGEMRLEYIDKDYPSDISTDQIKTLFKNNVERIDLSTVSRHSPAFESTFLKPIDADIDALQATLRRSNHPPTTYLDYFVSLKLSSGHFDSIQTS